MELVACVTSAVRNRHQRDLIRSTWGSEPFLKTHFGLVRLRAPGREGIKPCVSEVLFFVGRGGTEESSDLVWLGRNGYAAIRVGWRGSEAPARPRRGLQQHLGQDRGDPQVRRRLLQGLASLLDPLNGLERERRRRTTWPRGAVAARNRAVLARRCLRFLLKCDDDAFVDIDAVVADLMASAPIGAAVRGIPRIARGLLWGHAPWLGCFTCLAGKSWR